MSATAIARLVQKIVAPLQRRVRLMVARAIIDLVDDEKKCQTLQVKVLADEVRAGVEHFQPYGFTSVPQPGAEGVWLSVGGNRGHGIVLAVGDRRVRLVGLAEGEVAVYDDQGSKVVLRRGGNIEVTAADDGEIVLNGGTHKVAREGDGTAGHTHGFQLAAGPYPVVGSIVDATDTIAQGADRVKA